ncbi:peptide MFS transporter [Sunxiuqinia elliptica]|uniref:POT family proton-dependent oligopeptide transporter n=1 Tax=Sunxiuqinia elliptica TaxID=655355 RepID=A0A4R6H9V6_9BACT|nr:peptide MFS transporter [Sunxiuqinia elliptica]TDO05132.1 POT family proton-dependent oligopeptide transporter [Sunxiuqinia elliptica]TDO64681.1 POT family proton-dependent oligopeptide transporter [Sunxiuqinia elliptica]
MAKNKHPKGLMILFFTEMWERFGYYLMLGIFTLYMIAPETAKFAGLGMSNMEAADIYGTYLALVYLTPFFGGLLADRFLGYRRSIYIGGLFMAAGYIGLSIPNSMMAFYISLLLIILGNGLFKPNVSVLLGKLYEKPEYEHLKDSGYNIFYMGINIGAFVCNFVAAWLRLSYGWGWAFAAAGVGMLIGVLWFAWGNWRVPEIKEADKISPKRENDLSLARIFTVLFLPAFAAAAIGWIIPNNIFGSDSNDAFIFFCLPVLYFFFNTWRTADKTEKAPIAALLSIFGVVIIFWAVFHQNGSALTYWAKNNTDRELGPKMEVVINTIASSEEVSTVPRERQITGLHGESLGTEQGPSYYFDNYTGELPQGNLDGKPDDITEQEWAQIKDGSKSSFGKLVLWPTELQASINPFFVVVLTPLVVAFFAFLGRRRKEPSTPGKIAWGMLISAVSWLVMVAAAVMSGNGADKASVAWLFGVYGVITIGELCLSPMGLSLVSKLAPRRIAALMMGGWFLSTAIGNKLSGVLSGMWDLFEKKSNFFLTNALLTAGAFLIILLLLPWLKRVYNEHVHH